MAHHGLFADVIGDMRGRKDGNRALGVLGGALGRGVPADVAALGAHG